MIEIIIRLLVKAVHNTHNGRGVQFTLGINIHERYSNTTVMRSSKHQTMTIPRTATQRPKTVHNLRAVREVPLEQSQLLLRVANEEGVGVCHT